MDVRRGGSGSQLDTGDPGAARTVSNDLISAGSIGRPIALLSCAAFVSVASMRVGDPLLPQVAQEFGVSAGDASVIATAFALAYGLGQLIWGALGDRFGKYRLVALMTLISALTAGAAAFAGSLATLGSARFAAGATAAAIVPLSMAFVGDHVPYRDRQAVLARFLTGTIFGLVAGQILGGLVGELVGWRAVFLVLGGLFLVIGLLLMVEARSPRVPPPVLTTSISPSALLYGYMLLFGRHWARIILATVFVEGFLFYGAFTFIGAYLRERFDLDYAIVGLLLGCFGIGGAIYALTVRRLVAMLGERGLALGGGALLTLGYLLVAWGTLALMAPAIMVLGLGMYMLHATLQTHATQMAPEARGLAVSTFANALFLGQAGGVWLAGLAVDRVGFPPVFVILGAGLALLGVAFALLIDRRMAVT
jgi:YNFM family putative membrane transporter